MFIFKGHDEGNRYDFEKISGFEKPPQGREFEETDGTAGVANR